MAVRGRNIGTGNENRWKFNLTAPYVEDFDSNVDSEPLAAALEWSTWESKRTTVEKKPKKKQSNLVELGKIEHESISRFHRFQFGLVQGFFEGAISSSIPKVPHSEESKKSESILASSSLFILNFGNIARCVL